MSVGASPVVPATTRPSLPWSSSQRASVDGAVEVERAVVVERRDHRREHPAEAGHQNEPSVRAVDAQRQDEVLVQLHPHVVVQPHITPVNIFFSPSTTRRHVCSRRGPVRRQAGDDVAHRPHDGPRLAVELDQPVDHGAVVGGVGVVVRRAVAQLPVAAELLELLVDREELLVQRSRRSSLTPEPATSAASASAWTSRPAGVSCHSARASRKSASSSLAGRRGVLDASARRDRRARPRVSAFAKPLIRSAWNVRKKGSDSTDIAAKA